MIVYPKNWNQNYEGSSSFGFDPCEILNKLYSILKKINVPHIGYSGGIDSTIMLDIMTATYSNSEIHTYIISSRKDHPDVRFARKGSKIYNTIHHEFIVKPTNIKTDKFRGDNAVRQLFELLPEFTDRIICCDGIDEFMCGYYAHQKDTANKYNHYLSRLLPDHLIPLSNASKNIEVYLTYLDDRLIDIYRKIPLPAKIDSKYRKKIIIKIAKYLNISNEFIDRNKYGFCDAFIEKDK